MDQSCAQTSFLLDLTFFLYVFFMAAYDFNFDLAQPSQTCGLPVNLTTRTLYVIRKNFYPRCEYQLTTFMFISLSRTNLFFQSYFPCFCLDISFHLEDWCLPLEVKILQGVIPLSSSRTLSSRFFLFLRLNSYCLRLSWLSSCLWYTPLWLLFIQALRRLKYSWFLEVLTVLHSTLLFPLLSDSYLLCILAHTSYFGHFWLSHLSCIPQYLSLFICLCDIWWRAAISQPFFGIFFLVTLRDFST